MSCDTAHAQRQKTGRGTRVCRIWVVRPLTLIASMSHRKGPAKASMRPLLRPPKAPAATASAQSEFGPETNPARRPRSRRAAVDHRLTRPGRPASLPKYTAVTQLPRTPTSVSRPAKGPNWKKSFVRELSPPDRSEGPNSVRKSGPSQPLRALIHQVNALRMVANPLQVGRNFGRGNEGRR